MSSQPTENECRRRAPRIPFPAELKLTVGERTVDAIIRDLSPATEEEAGFIGIGLLHQEPLPLQTEIACECLTRSSVLSRRSTVLLTWSRHFGADGYLSGGMMVRQPERRPAASDTQTLLNGETLQLQVQSHSADK